MPVALETTEDTTQLSSPTSSLPNSPQSPDDVAEMALSGPTLPGPLMSPSQTQFDTSQPGPASSTDQQTLSSLEIERVASD